MDIYIYSNSRKVQAAVKANRKSTHFSVPSILPREKLKPGLKTMEPGSLVYLDVTGLEEKESDRILRLLEKDDNFHFGLIDTNQTVKDPSQIFHRGYCDYINRTALIEGITAKRLNRVHRFLEENARNLDRAVAPARGLLPYLPSGKDWRQIAHEQEYSFSMLYIELDGTEDMEKKYGHKNLGIALSSFRNFVETSVRPYQGKLWIWSRFGGIVLFPFDGTECPQLRCCFRLVLCKHLYDIEESLFPNFLSFRMALHIGNVVYTEENTGHVISDSLNFIFHLGQQIAQPGTFYITEEVLRLGQPVLKGFFFDAGLFEGRKLLQMRKPIHGAAI